MEKLQTINIAAKFFVCKSASSKWGKSLYQFELLFDYSSILRDIDIFSSIEGSIELGSDPPEV